MFKTNNQSAYKVRIHKFKNLKVTFKKKLEKIMISSLIANKFMRNLIFNQSHWLLIMKENNKLKNHFYKNLSRIKMKGIQKSKELIK